MLLALALTTVAVAAPPLPTVVPPVNGGDEPVPDVVRLRDGGELSGRVLVQNYDGVVLRQGSREREIPAAEVQSVDSREHRLASVLEHLRVVRDDDVRAFADLAQVCDARGLPNLARLLYHRVLTLDETHDRAHEELGHRLRSGSWTAQQDGKWFRWSDIVQRTGEWNRAWELETPHYDLRTNLVLEDAIEAALDLERFYLFFYDSLGSELGVHHVRDPLEAHLHADPASFPAIGHGRRAYYDPNTRRINVDTTSTDARRALLHEATHQLLEVSASGRLGSGQVTPAWLSEGLAEYFSLSAEGAPGRARFRAGQVASMHAYAHSRAEKPLGLTRMLALEPSDFLTSKDASLYYSQAWTLVHLSLHDVDDRYREGFLRYLTEVYEGKGSPSGFRKHVAQEDDFEAVWAAHARRLAGGRR